MGFKDYAGGAWENAKSSVKNRGKWTGLWGPSEKSLRHDPLPTFSFLVELDLGKGKEAQALFQSVSGLQYNTQVVPVGAGGVNNTTFKLVGHTEWPNLVLKRGFSANSHLIVWRQEWLDRYRKKRFGGSITLLDTALNPKGMWHFDRGWPCKWDISEFNASKNEIAIETLEIAHDGLRYGMADREGIYGGVELAGSPETPKAPDVPSVPDAPQTPDLSGGYKRIA